MPRLALLVTLKCMSNVFLLVICVSVCMVRWPLLMLSHCRIHNRLSWESLINYSESKGVVGGAAGHSHSHAIGMHNNRATLPGTLTHHFIMMVYVMPYHIYVT
jgi:hypothetical protein